MGKISF